MVACGLDVVGAGGVGGSVAPPDSGARLPGTDGGTVVDGEAVPDAAPPVCAADASFVSDQRNCGTCGHDCLGGKCVAGACQPFTLASGLNGPYAIASDGALLYVSLYEDKRIVSCPVTGCTTATQVTTTLDGPSTIAVLNGMLYWSLYTNGDLYTCTLPTCTDAHRIHTSEVGGADPGAIHGTTLFIPSFHAPNNVVSCDLPQCATYHEVYRGTEPDGVAVNDTSIFIGEFGAGTILQCPSTGCPTTPTTFASGQGGPTGIALDGRRLYWANNKSGSGAIMTCPLGGCGASGPTTLVPNEEHALGVVVDDKRIVWTTWQTNTGTVRAIAK
jgi:hypothetical protein